ncbi:MAG: hypothetical protein Q4A98_01655 [Comamonadaceae bacterium]|nr:hypothetical protein [Comamonadaceae bacterium]
MHSNQRLWVRAGSVAAAALAAALVVQGCASPLVATAPEQNVQSDQQATVAGKVPRAGAASAMHKQYQCATGERIGLSYIGQAGQPGERAILAYAGQRIAMQPLPHAPGQYVAEDAENSYRWSEGLGALRFKAAGASAQEVDVLTQCREVAAQPGHAAHAPSAPQS